MRAARAVAVARAARRGARTRVRPRRHRLQRRADRLQHPLGRRQAAGGRPGPRHRRRARRGPVGRQVRRAAREPLRAATATTATRPATTAVVVDVSTRSTPSATPTGSPRSAPARGSAMSTPARAQRRDDPRRARARRSRSAGSCSAAGWGSPGRAMGLTLDRVRSFDVVTADGERRARRRRRRLFWALRGGGGSFAIVTAVRLRTRASARAAFFRIAYPRGAREEALAAGTRFAPSAPARRSPRSSPSGRRARPPSGSTSAARRGCAALIAPLGRRTDHRQRGLPDRAAPLGGDRPRAQHVRRLLALRRQRLSERGRARSSPPPTPARR